MKTPQSQYRQTFETYFERFLAADEYDDAVEAANVVVDEFADELKDAEQDTFSLAFGFCLFSPNGPTQYWTEFTDSKRPEELAVALAQSALVNDILNEA